MRRIIVCGSRDWTDRGAVFRELTDECAPYPRVVIVNGACPTGADAMAEDWAASSGELHEEHPANWQLHGKSAGFRRNAEMAALGADRCLAFWDGESRGTAHMISCAVKQGIPVRIVPKVNP